MRGKITPRIKSHLLYEPELRDNDELLIKKIWTEDLGGEERLKLLPGDQLLDLVAKRKLTSYATVRRVRAKLQEVYPHLRGKLYVHRTQNMNSRMRDEVNEFEG